ncbi:MAG: class I SAM-dependent methyltransferase [Nitrososphaerota archaeon]
MSGLGEVWPTVERALAQIGGAYDRINRFLSLGFDVRLRERAIRIAGRDCNGRVLDAGSGPGTFSQLALRIWRGADLVAMDPLGVMVNLSKLRIRTERFDAVRGVFERMPFRDGCFDVVLTGFSIRDAIDLRKAISEVRGVLREGGSYVLCDISKPDLAPMRSIVSTYWFLVAPLLGLLAAGVKGLRVWDIYRTYRRWPERGKLIGLLRRYFSVEKVVNALLGGALIVVCMKNMIVHPDAHSRNNDETIFIDS